MKRLIELALLSCILVACNPSAEFSTFDPANAKGLNDKDSAKKDLIKSADVVTDSAKVEVVYVLDSTVASTEEVKTEQEEVTQVVQTIVSNLPENDIDFHFYPSTAPAITTTDNNNDLGAVSEPAVQITDVLTTETLDEISDIFNQDGQVGNSYTTIVHENITTTTDVAVAVTCEEATAPNKKINVCHKTPNHRQDIWVSVNAVPALTAHGDFIGTCALESLVNTCGAAGVNLSTMKCNQTAEETSAAAISMDPCPTSKKKVTICHKAADHGHDINVSVNAVKAHAAHGDFIGSCALQDLVNSCGERGVNLTTMTCK